jgi:hypothetical protein
MRRTPMLRTFVLVGSFCLIGLVGCAQLASVLQRQPTPDVIAIDPGPDNEVGTADDIFISGPGPDGELGTDDDVVVPGKSRLEVLVSTGKPFADAAGFGPWALLAQTLAAAATQGYALATRPMRRREEGEDGAAA